MLPVDPPRTIAEKIRAGRRKDALHFVAAFLTMSGIVGVVAVLAYLVFRSCR